MLKLSFIELLERGLPEALILIWSCYLLTKTKLKLNKYIITAIIFATLNYFVRYLPIQYGLNTILAFGILIFINIKLTKIPAVKAIKVSFFVLITELICEILNLGIIKYVFKIDIARVFGNSQLKTLDGIPSLILFIIIIIIANIVLKKISIRRNIV